MISQPPDVTLRGLINMVLDSIASKHRQYRLKHALAQIDRDTELTQREISDRQVYLRMLAKDRINIKHQLQS